MGELDSSGFLRQLLGVKHGCVLLCNLHSAVYKDTLHSPEMIDYIAGLAEPAVYQMLQSLDITPRHSVKSRLSVRSVCWSD